MPSARRVHFLLKLTSYFNFEVGGVHTISPIAGWFCLAAMRRQGVASRQWCCIEVVPDTHEFVPGSGATAANAPFLR